ncbi:MaoC-like dehydratase domain [Dillenia turbinata]|uniref:MaoC-like dehydratase domain n=1 Tax=Dillenia turbinata TaxID=194707 RepID=A0AAN8V548_9MAGN
MLIRHLASRFSSSLKFSSSSETGSYILKTGDILTKMRIFSDWDVIEYSKVSHDANPLHFDAEFARNAGFDDRLVHGMLVASLFPQIIASYFPGAVYASQSLHFRLPVYIGDQITGEVQAINIREHKKRYLVKFSTRCYKRGTLVLEGEAMASLATLVPDQVQNTD